MAVEERTNVVYLVEFDNGATHYEKDIDKARQFAEERGGTGGYGKPVSIIKVTRRTTFDYEQVCEF